MAVPHDQLAALREYQAAFLAAIPETDPATPVPWCGRWKVKNLVVHLARIHHWAAAQARRRQEEPLGKAPSDLARFYAECASELRETLAELDPDARAWTLLDDGVPRAEQTGTVRFWHRRQALETLIHTWDLRTANGGDFDPGPAAWLDCVDEVATVMHPRQVRLGRIAAPSVRLRLLAEAGESWSLAGTPPDGPETTVSGPARSLALLVWGRTNLDDPTLTISGDRAAADALLAAGLTP
jgi:uncharacterized protein (TIGR03083 family)